MNSLVTPLPDPIPEGAKIKVELVDSSKEIQGAPRNRRQRHFAQKEGKTGKSRDSKDRIGRKKRGF